MKYLIHYMLLVTAVILFSSCQKELSFDGVADDGKAVGSLKSASGICLPGLIFGSFTKDSVLKATDIIELYADITKTGTYIIKSDTVGGFYFSGSGTVTSKGINTIQIRAFGTPTTAGAHTFTFTFGTSVCKIDVYVNATTTPPAAYTFTCAGTAFGTGVYTAGSPVGAQHTVTLNVAVTIPGPWTINSDTVNGVFFSGSGTFAAAGNTQVTLTAGGTPVAVSPPPYNYRVASGGAVCSFAINVAAAPPPPNLDYVPQTTNSNWSAKLVGGTPSDTTYVQVSANSKTFGANSYKIFEVKDNGTPTDSIYNRKNGGEYYQYIDGNLGVLDNPINQEYMVLDSTKAVNFTWFKNFGPNVAMGFPLSNIRVDALILAKGETQTVASITYNNVIRMKYTYTATVIGLGDIPVAEEERWFAKGIGMIRSSIVNLVNPATTVNETTRAQIF
ncbi:MAG: hypothetical protein JNM14_00490 [Ferruginibacter sp.]|nr:hypothetical protein [Ferruginibacter sp.]